jgi:HrpA-like RNA helicase
MLCYDNDPINSIQLKETAKYIEMAVEKVISIHVSELARKGDILLFLPGKEEVEQACMILQKLAPDLMTLPVYAALPFETQCQIFSSTPPGIRKVIIY